MFFQSSVSVCCLRLAERKAIITLSVLIGVLFNGDRFVFCVVRTYDLYVI